MSTRSMIAYRDPDTGYTYSIYCHMDGSPDWNGKILINHYNHIEKIRELFALGNLSQLGNTPTECVAYMRDWGRYYEDNFPKPFPVANPAKYFTKTGFAFGDVEYLYTFRKGQWWVTDEENTEPHSIPEAIAEIERHRSELPPPQAPEPMQSNTAKLPFQQVDPRPVENIDDLLKEATA